MKMNYSNQEMADKHLMNGLAERNGTKVRRLYRERSHDKCLSRNSIIREIYARLNETDLFRKRTSNTGKSVDSRNVEVLLLYRDDREI